MYYLLTNAHTHTKLVDEIRRSFPSYSAITAVAAQSLPYLQAVIEEGLRIYPSGALGFPRKSPGIRVDGHWIPPGVSLPHRIRSAHTANTKQVEIYTSSWTTHHDPDYFHDPDTFKPERWLDPNCADTKEASQPFSLGPRGCLGRKCVFILFTISTVLNNSFLVLPTRK